MGDKTKDNADWSLATWEGAELETLRRWARLPLESIIAALEEMQMLNEALHGSAGQSEKVQATSSGIQQQRGDYACRDDEETSDK